MADREWLWADPIVLNFNSERAYKEVNVSQWREARLYVQMKCTGVWLNQASNIGHFYSKMQFWPALELPNYFIKKTSK